MNDSQPLLHAKRPRLIAGATFLVPIAVAVLFPSWLAAHVGVEAVLLEVGALVLFVALTWWLASDLRCPACGRNLFWYGVNEKFGNWVNWLLTVRTCPKCGYSAKREDR